VRKLQYVHKAHTGQIMKIVRLDEPGGVDVLQYVDVPLPIAGPGDVLVRARAIGVGKPDLLIRQGTYRWMPPLPAIPGNELAGVVEAVGAEVRDLRVGQSVLVSSRELTQRGGCYAEVVCVPAESVYPLPDGIAPEDAVSLPNYQLAGALLQVATAGWKPTTVLVQGAAGGVATAVIQLAASAGIDVIGTASSDAKCRFAKANGATDVIEYRREDVAARVRDLTAGRGVDLVLDHVAGPRFTSNLELLAPLGLLVSYNALGGLPEKDLFAELRRLVGRSLAVRCFSIHTLDALPELRRRLMQQAIDLLASGRIRPPPPTILPLSEARQAHEMLEQAETLGKVVLRPD
jgi:NADPH2:quinone reductase